MKSLTNKQKNGISLCILGIFLAIIVIVGIIVGSIPVKNNGNTAIRVGTDGKAEMVLNVKEDAISLAEGQTFEGYFQEYLNGINGQSGNDDFVKMKSCVFKDGTYEIRLVTRRVDKLRGVCDIDYGTGEDFSALDGKLKKIEEYDEGTVRERFNKIYPNGESGMVELKKSDNKKKIQPKTVDGALTSYQDFSQYLQETKDSILLFKVLDASFIEKFTLQTSGKIKYVSSENITIVDAHTIEVTPMKMNARMNNEAETTEVGAFLGYVVYETNLSLLAICAIAAGCVLFIWFLTCGFVLGWFRVFFTGELWRKIVKYKTMYVLLIPGLAFLIIFHYAPMVGLTTAFQEYDLVEGAASEWVGGKYFQKIFMANTDRMYRIFRNTIFISLLRIGSNFPLILMFALFVNSIKNTRVKSVVQTVSFIPYFLSWAAVAGLLYAVISDFGLLNSLLGILGLEQVSWYGEIDAWWTILSVSSLWKGMGWGTLIYISAMCNIDSELYEAASLDGCGAMRRMFTVTLPGIMPMICMQLILDSSSLMKDNYEQILALTNGATGLKDRLEVIGQVSYDSLRNGSGFGSATALGMIQGGIGLILVFVTNKIVKKTDNPGIL